MIPLSITFNHASEASRLQKFPDTHREKAL